MMIIVSFICCFFILLAINIIGNKQYTDIQRNGERERERKIGFGKLNPDNYMHSIVKKKEIGIIRRKKNKFKFQIYKSYSYYMHRLNGCLVNK